MQEKSIEKYLELLEKQLINFQISNYQIILDNIQNQIESILQIWNNTNLRNTILFFSMEEALYYKPECNIYIKSFVVTTIRNSLIESAGSDFYQIYDFKNVLQDDNIKTITSTAINFFKNFDFEKNANIYQSKKIDNCYLKVINKYPLAWEIVSKLANLKGTELYFTKLDINDNNRITLIPMGSSKQGDRVVIEDGISPYFNQTLCDTLKNCVDSNAFFFSDSFKFVTRNFEKLLKIIQYLLENDREFVTFNVYISNGFVSKRKEFLRPSHKVKDMNSKYKITNGLSKKHKNAIEKGNNSI